MIVEFAGLPGGGKTTLLHEVDRMLSQSGIEVRSGADVRRSWIHPEHRAATLPGRLRRAGALVLRAPLLAVVAVTLIRSPRPRAERWVAFRWFVVALEQHLAASRVGDDVVVLIDEGMVQRTFLLFVEAAGVSRGRLVDRYRRRAPRADLVVLVDAEPDVALGRLRGRSRGVAPRLEALGDEALSARFVEARGLLEGSANRAGGVVVTVALDGVDVGASEVVRVIEQRRGRRSATLTPPGAGGGA